MTCIGKTKCTSEKGLFKSISQICASEKLFSKFKGVIKMKTFQVEIVK